MKTQEKVQIQLRLDKYKVGIVARGFLQKERIDYNKTTTSTANFASWRILMALSAINEWYILEADFIAAYLSGSLSEVIYINQFLNLTEFFLNHPEFVRSLI